MQEENQADLLFSPSALADETSSASLLNRRRQYASQDCDDDDDLFDDDKNLYDPSFDIDWRELFYEHMPNRVNGFEVDFERRDCRYWFMNKGTCKLLGLNHFLEGVGQYIGCDVHLAQEEIDWWLDLFKDMVDRKEKEREIRRAFVWEDHRIVIKSRLVRLDGPWPLPRILQFSQDITEEDELEEKLALTRVDEVRNSHKLELLQRFFLESPDILGTTRLEAYDAIKGQYTNFMFTVCNRGELVHKHGTDHYKRNDVERWIEKCEEARQLEKSQQFEVREQVTWYKVTVRWQDNNCYSFSMHDITAEKLKSNELQNGLEECHRDLTEAQQVKSKFLATVSHELRTPLNGVMGSLALIQDATDRAEPIPRDLLHLMRICGEHLTALVDDMLDATRLTTEDPYKELVLEPAPFCLTDVVYESLEIVSFAMTPAQRDEVDLSKSLDHKAVPDRLLGDSRRLRQVLVNLLQNAVKFTPSGEVEISCDGERSSCRKEGDTIGQYRFRIHVRDTGVGIPDDLKSKLFQPFSRGDDPVSRAAGGVGLGLYICSRIINRMGGTVSFDSTLGKGSTFTISLCLPIVAPDTSTACELPPMTAPLPNVILLRTSTWAKKSRYIQKLLSRYAFPSITIVDDTVAPPVSDAAQVEVVLIAGKCPRELPSGRPVVLFDYDAPPEHARAKGVVYVRKPCRSIGLVRALALGTPAPSAKANLRRSDGLTKSHCLTSSGTSPQRSIHPFLSVSGVTASPSSFCRSIPVHKERILVAEDNATNQRILKKMLERMGYLRVHMVANGADAVHEVQEHAQAGEPFQAILMDLMMPVMDGIEATKQIRSLKGIPQPRIIALTAADNNHGQRDACTDAKMDDFLMKPIRVPDLEKSLSQIATHHSNNR